MGVAAKSGLIYEGKVVDGLRKIFGLSLVSNPWFAYFNTLDQKFLFQPDAIMDRGDGRVFVFEVKRSQVEQARAELFDFYLPLLQVYYKGKELFPIAITRWYDPRDYVKGEVMLVNNFLRLKSDVLNLKVWRPGMDMEDFNRGEEDVS